MKVTVTHLGGLAFAGVGKTGEVTKMVAGSGDSEHLGNSPMELVLMGAAGCSGIDIIGMLEKMRIDFSRLEISVQGERAEEHPRVFTDVQITYKFWGGNLPEDKLRRAIELSLEKYCSVVNMVNKTAKIIYALEIHG